MLTRDGMVLKCRDCGASTSSYRTADFCDDRCDSCIEWSEARDLGIICPGCRDGYCLPTYKENEHECVRCGYRFDRQPEPGR
jgi:uncharacterized CHY-type Zn-finger protein